MATLLVSADLDELIGLSDTIMVMLRGRLVATLDPSDVTPRTLGAYMTGADTALVEFVARYKHGGAPAVRLHEVSRFVREDGRWYYLDGDFPQRG